MKKFPAKAQRRKEKPALRRCAFAGNFFVKTLGLLLLCGGIVAAQEKERTRITISIPTPGQIQVEAKLSSPARSWSFRNVSAGALGIAERVERLRAFGDSDQDAGVKKSATGEFRSDLDAKRINYTVKLSTPRTNDIPHASWLVEDRGILMFADLLPRDIESLSAEFVLPAEWKVESSIAPDVNGRYEVPAPEKSVFFIGRALRKTSKSVAGMMLEIVLSGAWRFKDDEALKAATRVLEKYFALTGFRLPGTSVIMIVPAPISLGNSTWKAETRGSTVVVLMDAAARVEAWLGQVSVIFTHELLHLWVPNSLKFEGDYDWFFEGFTLYMALRTATDLKIVNFKGFLGTLAGVYDSYIAHRDDLSLIEASERRWTSPVTNVYVKGMLVAFLYDLMLRKESAGKTTLADRYRDLFKGGVADNGNGNEAIIRLLGSTPAINGFTKSYIESGGEIKLEELLPAYGLQLDSSGKNSQLRVSSQLSEEQKQLLRALGYRN